MEMVMAATAITRACDLFRVSVTDTLQSLHKKLNRYNQIAPSLFNQIINTSRFNTGKKKCNKNWPAKNTCKAIC